MSHEEPSAVGAPQEPDIMIPERTHQPGTQHDSPDERNDFAGAHATRVLMYHRVVQDRALADEYWFCIHADDFRRHLECIDRWGFTPITLEDIRVAREKQLSLPRKPVIITFDDGYLDTYEVAFPLLQEFGMRAVVFVIGDRSIHENVWDKDIALPPARLLSDRQIFEMYEAGMEIGAHSMSHTRLTTLAEDRAWEEISRSRMLLEILLNAPVRSFSYPYGDLSAPIKRMVASAGYLNACSVGSGPAVFGRDPLEIRRITIRNSTTTTRFAMRLSASYQYYSWARWKLGTAMRGPRGARRPPSNGSPPAPNARRLWRDEYEASRH